MHGSQPNRLLALVLLGIGLGSCGFGQSDPRSVPGTSAFVNDKVVSPLHEGQYIGRLDEVDGACKGESGSESSGSIDVTLHIDEYCRVFVESIER